jgi:hypothetical protein
MVFGTSGIVTAMSIPGATTLSLFDSIVAEFLVSGPRRGLTVVLDSRFVDKKTTVQRLNGAAGFQLRSLPRTRPAQIRSSQSLTSSRPP